MVWGCLILSVAVFPARQSVTVVFDNVPVVSTYVPFAVVLPQSATPVAYVRFTNPSNGATAVAHVVDQTGDLVRANPELQDALGIESASARLWMADL